VADGEASVLIPPTPSILLLYSFCHNSTLQHHRLPSVTTNVTNAHSYVRTRCISENSREAGFIDAMG
jgi:hypothetical protein